MIYQIQQICVNPHEIIINHESSHEISRSTTKYHIKNYVKEFQNHRKTDETFDRQEPHEIKQTPTKSHTFPRNNTQIWITKIMSGHPFSYPVVSTYNDDNIFGSGLPHCPRVPDRFRDVETTRNLVDPAAPTSISRKSPVARGYTTMVFDVGSMATKSGNLIEVPRRPHSTPIRFPPPSVCKNNIVCSSYTACSRMEQCESCLTRNQHISWAKRV